MRFIRLEVRVDVLGVVFRIDEAMKAVARRVVVIEIPNAHHVFFAEQLAGQGQPIAGPVRLSGMAVDLQLLDRAPAEIEEQWPFAGHRERERRLSAVGGEAGRQLEIEAIVGVVDAGGTRGGLGLPEDVARLAGEHWRVGQGSLRVFLSWASGV